MQVEVLKRLHPPKLGPCACSQVRRLARKLSSFYDTVLSSQDLRALLALSESAVARALQQIKKAVNP
jgi:hypothetical protein